MEGRDAAPPSRPPSGPRTGMRGSPRARIGLCCAAHADPDGSPPTEEETMDKKLTTEFVDKAWDSSIVPTLTEYIRIPNKSPAYDKDSAKHGHMDRAVKVVEGWCRSREIEGMKLEVVRLPERTPVIFMEIPGTSADKTDTVLLYGHLDKQPEMTGWSAGLGPWEPVMKGDKLYGRGGADDGYATFASLTAIGALKAQKIPHARCVVLIEACEESGSYDLPFYIDHLEKRIGAVSLVVRSEEHTSELQSRG